MDYQQKYLKYKNKYLTLKAQMGGKKTYVQKYDVYPQQICEVNKAGTNNYCNCPKYETDVNNIYCKHCGHPEYLHKVYSQDYTNIYTQKCEVYKPILENGNKVDRYCNCPGFMSIDDTLKCIRCDHYKANHKI
jgi:hypothetical protein